MKAPHQLCSATFLILLLLSYIVEAFLVTEFWSKLSSRFIIRVSWRLAGVGSKDSDCCDTEPFNIRDPCTNETITKFFKIYLQHIKTQQTVTTSGASDRADISGWTVSWLPCYTKKKSIYRFFPRKFPLTGSFLS